MSDEAAALIKDGDWTLFLDNPEGGLRVWTYDDGRFIHVKTEYLANEELLDQNTAIRNHTAGERWGDERHYASVPLHIYFRELAEARKQEDKAYIRKWINNPDHRAFRTFEGNL